MSKKEQQFIRDFESGCIGAGEFGHRDHVRLAWAYLTCNEVPEAMLKMKQALRRFAAGIGKPDLYHETVTCAYVALIAECMHRDRRRESWQSFSARFPELFDRQNSLLGRYYRTETLASDLARRVFLLPDAQSRDAPATRSPHPD